MNLSKLYTKENFYRLKVKKRKKKKEKVSYVHVPSSRSVGRLLLKYFCFYHIPFWGQFDLFASIYFYLVKMFLPFSIFFL